ncbi:MAG: M3 family metallopeptidase [Pseudomonadota bacterium]
MTTSMYLFSATPLSASAQDSGENTVNPLLAESSLPGQFPRFDRIRDEHFLPAFRQGMQQQLAEVAEIASNPGPASFDNTIVELEKTGMLLRRTSRAFFNLRGTDSNEQRQAIEREIRPLLSAHYDSIRLNAPLFARIDVLFKNRSELGLTPEQLRLLEDYHRDYMRAGAALSEDEKDRLKELNRELARLSTQFSQNVLKEVQDSAVVLDSEADLAGLSIGLIEAAASEAKARGLDGKYVLTLKNYTSQPTLSSLTSRATREKLMRASLARGTRGGDFDNRETVVALVKLRAERAQLLGYNTHADYVLEERTAKNVAAVQDLLYDLAPVAVANARREGAALQEMINETEDEPFELASWDWPYYAEKVRSERFDFDASTIKPYFELDNVLKKGLFYAASELYGISFEPRPDLPSYHPDARVWEVFDKDGTHLAFFIGDFYARNTKRGGAWMNSYVTQSTLLGTTPVIANHVNITKPPEGEPTLLSLDEVETLFHEFGHALHGMFSDVTYPRFAGTATPRDFVEYPSQVNEMWAIWPKVLENYAIHYQTGETIPAELLQRVIDAAQFNEGYRTTEYLTASVLDMCYHTLTSDDVPSADEVDQFEASCLREAGFDYAPVPSRYRSAYFSHAMGGYAAGYYSYIWSEVLDADSSLWLSENGGLTRANGDLFRETVLSKGGSKEAMQLFRDFMGRDADIQPLLERRGLVGTGS